MRLSRALWATTFALPLLVTLTGCFLVERQGSEPVIERKLVEEPAVVDEVVGQLQPITGNPDHIPTTDELFQTLLDAGHEPGAIETTMDISPLGNDVPSKMFGVKVKEGCVIGEIRGGEASGTLVAPNESTGTCFHGHVIRPEGAPAPSGDELFEGDEDGGTGHRPGDNFDMPAEGN